MITTTSSGLPSEYRRHTGSVMLLECLYQYVRILTAQILFTFVLDEKCASHQVLCLGSNL